MGKAVLAARVILGLLFVLFGVNYFIPFLPMPENPPAGQAFLGALFATGYMFPMIKLTEIIGGLLVLLGFVPIGLLLLTPVVVNIVAFHAFLAPGGMGLSTLMVLLMAFLAWAYRSRFALLFRK